MHEVGAACMHEVACVSTEMTLRLLPSLGPLVVLGAIASWGAYRMGVRAVHPQHRGRVRLGYDLIIYDSLRAIGLYCGWLTIWGFGSLIAPCWFLRTEQFIGLWFWLGVPVVVTRYLLWMRTHEDQRRKLDDLGHSHERSTT